jgi:hypothetical protein
MSDKLFGTYRMHRGERMAEWFRHLTDYAFRLALAGMFLYLAWWLLDAEYYIQACHPR